MSKPEFSSDILKIMDMFAYGNNPYRETEMRVKCPVTYDKSLNNHNNE